MVRRANKGGRVTILSTGTENIPEKDGFIYFPNHQGLYDVIAIMEASTKPFGAVAKKEVRNVPLLKQVFACTNSFIIDRENIREGLKTIMQIAKAIEGGRNYCIFPEGTRSGERNVVREFKGGSFKAAIMSKCAIVPVALIDSNMPFDSKTTKPVTVQVHFLLPIYYEEYEGLKSTEIAKIVRERIVEKIEAQTSSIKNATVDKPISV
jgi:1-acyl-sn-glycerol-3-phosphate acyltransferase